MAIGLPVYASAAVSTSNMPSATGAGETTTVTGTPSTAS